MSSYQYNYNAANIDNIEEGGNTTNTPSSSPPTNNTTLSDQPPPSSSSSSATNNNTAYSNPNQTLCDDAIKHPLSSLPSNFATSSKAAKMLCAIIITIVVVAVAIAMGVILSSNNDSNNNNNNNNNNAEEEILDKPTITPSSPIQSLTTAPPSIVPFPLPTTLAPSTVSPTTVSPSTLPPTPLPTSVPTTALPITPPPITTSAPSKAVPITSKPSTVAPTTSLPITITPLPTTQNTNTATTSRCILLSANTGPLSQVLEISIVYDLRPLQTSWTLERVTPAANELILSYFESNKKAESYSESICLDDGEYVFVISDSNNDGICCERGDGSYTVSLSSLSSDGEAVIIAEGGDFGESESTSFTLPLSS